MRNALFLLLSVGLGWGFTILLDGTRHLRLALPMGLSFGAGLLLLALAAYWQAHGFAKKHGTGHPAADLKRQGRAFRVWFSSHGLLWALIYALAIVLCVQAFYWQWWVVAMVAGLSSALFASLLGLIWATRTPLLGLCWRYDEATSSPLQFSKHLSLKLRYDEALDRDFQQAKPQVPYLMAILEQGTVAGIARYVRLQPKALPWKQEILAWLRGTGLLSAVSALLFFIVLLFLGGLNQLLDSPLQLPGAGSGQQARLDPNQQDAVASDLESVDVVSEEEKPQDEGEPGDSQENQAASDEKKSSSDSDSGSPSDKGQPGDSGSPSNASDGSQPGQQGQQSSQQGQPQPSQSGSQGEQGMPSPSQGQQSGGGSGQDQPGEGQQSDGGGQDQQGSNPSAGEGAQGREGEGSGQSPSEGNAQSGGRKKSPGNAEGTGGQGGDGNSPGQGGKQDGDGQGKGQGQGGNGGGSGDGYGTGGDAPKLGDAREITMPPPGVGDVVTIEAPEQQIEGEADPNADTENARADDQPPEALVSRDQRRAENGNQVEKQEGQSLQYLPNWVRHIKEKANSDQNQQ